MAMGTRKQRERQEPLWYRGELPEAPSHPFYRRLNDLLEREGSFLHQNVSPGSTIYTDGLKSFEGLTEAGFQHIRYEEGAFGLAKARRSSPGQRRSPLE